jgi:hypothetical protein
LLSKNFKFVIFQYAFICAIFFAWLVAPGGVSLLSLLTGAMIPIIALSLSVLFVKFKKKGLTVFLILATITIHLLYTLFYDYLIHINGGNDLLFSYRGDENKYLSHARNGITDQTNILNSWQYFAHSSIVSILLSIYDSVYTVKIFNYIPVIFIILYSYKILNIVSNDTVARIGVCLLLFNPEFHLWSHTLYKDIYITLFLIITLYAWIRLQNDKRYIVLFILSLSVLFFYRQVLPIVILISIYLTYSSYKKIFLSILFGLLLIKSVYNLSETVRTYIEIYLNADRVSYAISRIGDAIGGNYNYTLIVVPIVLFLLMTMMLMQPLILFKSIDGDFSALNLYTQLSAIYWFAMMPFFFIGAFYITKNKHTSFLLFRNIIFVYVLILVLTFMLFTIRHKFAILPLELFISAYGLFVVFYQKLCSINKVLYLYIVIMVATILFNYIRISTGSSWGG